MDNFIPKAPAMKKQALSAALLATVAATVLTCSCRKETVITFRSLLREMASEETLTRYPSPAYRLVQFSSYDRRSIDPDSSGWYANDDYTNFIREEDTDGRHEYVMLEADGPGAIVRWWMTFGNANAMNSYIRVYLDGQTVPVIEGRAPELIGGGVLAPAPLSTSVSPMTEPQRRGYNLYLPIPFSEKCRITLENDSVIITQQRHTPSIYYNIDARLCEKGTRVVSAKSEMFSDDTLAIAECASDLAGDGISKTDEKTGRSTEGLFPPGTECTLALTGKGLAVSSISLKLSGSDTAAVLKGAVIRLYFDGAQTAEVPAGNFFGTGYSFNTFRTRFTAADPDGTLHAAWLMPFRDSTRLTIFNATGDTIAINARMGLTSYKWDSNSMYFGTSWKEYRGFETAGSEYTEGTGLHTDINIADLKGRGLYAGDAVLVFNTADAWWGEGDEKIYVDGEQFPSSFGTGTEDYYGYAWCRPEPFDHPLIAQPAGDGNFHPGMSVNMRYRILDAIPFSESLKADIEMWHWVKTKIDFSVTAYYYLTPEPLSLPLRSR